MKPTNRYTIEAGRGILFDGVRLLTMRPDALKPVDSPLSFPIQDEPQSCARESGTLGLSVWSVDGKIHMESHG